MKGKKFDAWPETWVTYMLDANDDSKSHKQIAEMMTDRFEVKFTGGMIKAMMERLKKGGFLR